VISIIACVAAATGAPTSSIRVALRPPLEVQSNRLYDAWAGDGMSFHQRLRRYLARGLAWPGHDFEDQLAALVDLTFFPDM